MKAYLDFAPKSYAGPDIINLSNLIITTMRHREGMGHEYPDGTLEDTIAAAQAVSTIEAQIMAIQNILTCRERKSERV